MAPRTSKEKIQHVFKALAMISYVFAIFTCGGYLLFGVFAPEIMTKKLFVSPLKLPMKHHYSVTTGICIFGIISLHHQIFPMLSTFFCAILLQTLLLASEMSSGTLKGMKESAWFVISANLAILVMTSINLWFIAPPKAKVDKSLVNSMEMAELKTTKRKLKLSSKMNSRQASRKSNAPYPVEEHNTSQPGYPTNFSSSFNAGEPIVP